MTTAVPQKSFLYSTTPKGGQGTFGKRQLWNQRQTASCWLSQPRHWWCFGARGFFCRGGHSAVSLARPSLHATRTISPRQDVKTEIVSRHKFQNRRQFYGLGPFIPLCTRHPRWENPCSLQLLGFASFLSSKHCLPSPSPPTPPPKKKRKCSRSNCRSACREHLATLELW